MPEADTYRIRPAGRHILTIGRDLIQDPYAAVIELVKNAYDADSPDVSISFEAVQEGGAQIVIADHGHGMSRDTVIHKWMVPSTSDKQDRGGRSPGGRTMQGRKGIGRYAASILGSDLLLESTTRRGEKTALYLEWSAFAAAEYLGDVDILIETDVMPRREPGTRLTIGVDQDHLAAWGGDEFRSLEFELRKLIPPFPVAGAEQFKVFLQIRGIANVPDTDSQVEPYPLVEYYDYRIAGTIHADGQGMFEYSQQKARNAPVEEVAIDFKRPSGCGRLLIDIRVYDRDAQSLDQLIQRGLTDASGNYLGRLEARRLLNDYNGIGVYRNGFRLRPLGDPEFDWLKLNEQRIQRPAFRIGNNQVIGYVQIESEERSQLKEKSARDGLIENKAFSRLKEITNHVIQRLEERRYVFRQRAGLSRHTIKVEQELERLYSFDDLKSDVRSTLEDARVSAGTTADVMKLIESDELRRSESMVRLRDTIAVYQGHATLGKIINVILHEGRRPLAYFRNQAPRLRLRAEGFEETRDPVIVPNIVAAAKGIADSAEDLVELFGRLDPLAAQRRGSRKKEVLAMLIERATETFSGEMTEAGIACEVGGDKTLEIECWRQDIQAIFTNLLDNSLYWLKEKVAGDRRVDIRLRSTVGMSFEVDYFDTGPGIEPAHIDSGVIFEPQFSTKPDGMGLGLAIAGEAAARNGLELVAFERSDGAWFRLQTGVKAQ